MSSKRFMGKCVVVSLAAMLLVVPNAFAGKPTGGGGKGGTGTLSLVLVNSTDGVPHYGQMIRFDVSTTATDRPFVAVNCSQAGTPVYSASAGYFPSYPWSSDMVLSSAAWTGGAADCTARLYYTTSNGREATLNTMTFRVYA